MDRLDIHTPGCGVGAERIRLGQLLVGAYCFLQNRDAYILQNRVNCTLQNRVNYILQNRVNSTLQNKANYILQNRVNCTLQNRVN